MNLNRSFCRYTFFSLLLCIGYNSTFATDVKNQVVEVESTSNEKNGTTKKPTVMLFGSNGAVGSNILSALLKQTISETNFERLWNEIILVGRRFISVEERELIKTISMTSLKDIDQNEDELESIQDTTVDACIIALGVGSPQDMDLPYWHSVEIDMIGSITRFCVNKGAKYISLLSSVDAEESPDPITKEELEKDNKPLGWLRMIMLYFRMKGLSEQAVIENASDENVQVSIMQPSQIVTETTRYGLTDWFLFKLLPILDPLMPRYWHSVHVKLLGMAFAKDAANAMRGDIDRTKGSIDRKTFNDFIVLSGDDFKVIQSDLDGTKWEL